MFLFFGTVAALFVAYAAWTGAPIVADWRKAPGHD
jgi:hypothetical protein